MLTSVSEDILIFDFNIDVVEFEHGQHLHSTYISCVVLGETLYLHDDLFLRHDASETDTSTGYFIDAHQASGVVLRAKLAGVQRTVDSATSRDLTMNLLQRLCHYWVTRRN